MAPRAPVDAQYLAGLPDAEDLLDADNDPDGDPERRADRQGTRTSTRLLRVQQPLRVPPSAPSRLVVLASGTGSLLSSLLDAAVGDYPARVVAVGADRDCRAVQIADAAAVADFHRPAGRPRRPHRLGCRAHRRPPPHTSPTWWCRRDS